MPGAACRRRSHGCSHTVMKRLQSALCTVTVMETSSTAVAAFKPNESFN